MKKLVLISAVALIASVAAKAQCTFYLITGSYTQITTNQTINATGGIYWICSGLTVNIASSQGDTYVCESNVTLNINGSSGDAVYAKSGCVINNNTSEDIMVFGSMNVTTNNNSSGSITNFTCNPVVFDYSMVQGGPGNCPGSSGITETNSIQVSLFPNPFSNQIIIAALNTAGNITICNALGQNILTEQLTSGNNTLQTENLLPGIYTMRIETPEGVAIRKLIKQ